MRLEWNPQFFFHLHALRLVSVFNIHRFHVPQALKNPLLNALAKYCRNFTIMREPLGEGCPSPSHQMFFSFDTRLLFKTSAFPLHLRSANPNIELQHGSTHVLKILVMILIIFVITFTFVSLFIFSWKHVVMLNLLLFSICIIFAIFLPHIGRIIG